jgi:hypothetical protein
MTCRCVLCPTCEGNGALYRSFRSADLRLHRTDGLDERVGCGACDGTGCERICEQCVAFADAAMRSLEEIP